MTKQWFVELTVRNAATRNMFKTENYFGSVRQSIGLSSLEKFLV